MNGQHTTWVRALKPVEFRSPRRAGRLSLAAGGPVRVVEYHRDGMTVAHASLRGFLRYEDAEAVTS